MSSRIRRIRRALFRLYYRVKYFPFARERRVREQGGRRDFIVIQLDALSHDDLLHAVRQGRAPRIRRLIERDGWSLRKYPAGLPSATPAAQAAIFFGTKAGIPAFRYYLKKERRMIVGSRPADVQHVRDTLPERGILENGSSYTNIFDGGADRAAFTLSAQQAQPLLQKMGGGRVGLLAMLHPIRMARMVLAGLYEYMLEEWNRLISQLKGQSTYYWWYLPLLHIGTDVVLRELQTLAVLLDIYVGVPRIYTTYNSYDEFAHHFGPRSRPALASVRAMDRRVAEILRMVRRLPDRDYDVYIISDHGQTESIPYRVEFGETLGDTIIAAARHGVLVMAGTGDYAPESRDAMDFLVRELEEVSAESNPATRSLGLRLGLWIRKHYGLFPLVAEVVREAAEAHLVVTYSSSLAHVYWTQPDDPIAFDEIRADPDRRGLHYFLVAHRGIGVVITRMLDGAHVESLAGRALVTPDGDLEILAGDNPLSDYAESVVELKEIARLAQDAHAGDMILFGAYDPDSGRCICFDDQVGAHGAMGGRQYWPFTLTPPGLVSDDTRIEDPLDLHQIFRRYDVARDAVPATTHGD
jgi:hypothetical protein